MSVSSRGWHMGISSCVFLAAMMPATCATASTSPFGTPPRWIRRNVSGFITMRPRAFASRMVSSFVETSTIIARPRESMCESFAGLRAGIRETYHAVGYAAVMAESSYPRIDITPHWQSVQDNLLTIVDLIPEDRLNWTPRPDLWNCNGILIHVSDARDGWMSGDVKDGDPYPNIWTTVKTKGDLKRELERTYARVQRFLSNQAQLDSEYPEEGPDGKVRFINSGHFIAFHLLEHDIHHRAELMQRLALMDIKHGIDL